MKSIAGYLEITWRRVYETLHRWVTEGVRGLEDKPPIPKSPRQKVDLRTVNEVRKLQENPELGEFRVHAALLQLGIKLSPRTCGRILALYRARYGIDKPERAPHDPRPCPSRQAGAISTGPSTFVTLICISSVAG